MPDDVVDEAARRLRVLGHPLRVRLVEMLAARAQTVSELAGRTGVEHHLVSKHLSELLRAGVVAREQAGNFAVYSLPDAWSLKAIALICRGVASDRARFAALVAHGTARAGE